MQVNRPRLDHRVCQTVQKYIHIVAFAGAQLDSENSRMDVMTEIKDNGEGEWTQVQEKDGGPHASEGIILSSR